jgi:cell division protein FtsB
MWSRNQRQVAVTLFLRRIGLVLLLIVVGFAASGVWGVYEKEKESRQLRTLAELERADLEKRHTQLSGEIKNLQSNRGMEEVLREQYALAAEGEGLIVIVEPPAPPPVQPTTTVFQKIKDFFWFWE